MSKGEAYFSIAEHVVEARISTEDHSRCAECGDRFDGEPNRWEVTNPDTGKSGVVHESCYLANDDILELA